MKYEQNFNWQGRTDKTDGGLYFHQHISPNQENAPAGYLLAGFPVDIGVRRNNGRPGAAAGPQALRKLMADRVIHRPVPVYDLGDYHPASTDLEAERANAAGPIADGIRHGHVPIVLGGGHETAALSHLALLQAEHPARSVGIINFDAHFDLRGDVQATSGTPFREILDWEALRQREAGYLVLGIDPGANAAGLLQRAADLGVEYISDRSLNTDAGRLHAAELLREFCRQYEGIHLSIDLDVLPGAAYPGVSAPAGLGLAPAVLLYFIEIVREINCENHGAALLIADICEYNPGFDSQLGTGRMAVRILETILGTHRMEVYND